jgi:hypothetical protein
VSPARISRLPGARASLQGLGRVEGALPAEHRARASTTAAGKNAANPAAGKQGADSRSGGEGHPGAATRSAKGGTDLATRTSGR